MRARAHTHTHTGVLGQAVGEGLRRRGVGDGAVAAWSNAGVAAGMLLCVPWYGRLSPVQFAAGCCVCAAAAAPLSAVAARVFRCK